MTNGGLVGVGIGAEISLGFPPLIPAAFDFLRVVGLRKFSFHRFVSVPRERIFSRNVGHDSQAMLSITCVDSF